MIYFVKIFGFINKKVEIILLIHIKIFAKLLNYKFLNFDYTFIYKSNLHNLSSKKQKEKIKKKKIYLYTC